MPNEQDLDLFSPTQGYPGAPFFSQGAVSDGGYGQPDPGSGIRINGNRRPGSSMQYANGAIGKVWPSYRTFDAPIRGRIPAQMSVPQEPQSMEPMKLPSQMNPFSAANASSMNPSVSSPLIRRASDGRQGTLPLVYSNYQELLRSLVGRWVIADFLVGTVIQRRSGIIMHVGTGYIVLRDPCTQAYTGCDLNTLRFFTVLPEGTKLHDSHCALRKFDRL